MEEQSGMLADQMEQLFSRGNIEEIECEKPNEWKIETRDGKKYKGTSLREALQQVPGMTSGPGGQSAM